MSIHMQFRRGIRGRERRKVKDKIKALRWRAGEQCWVIESCESLFLSSRATLFSLSSQFRFSFEQISLAAWWQPVIAHRWILSTDAVCCKQRARPCSPHKHYTDENGYKGLAVCVGWYTCNYTYWFISQYIKPFIQLYVHWFCSLSFHAYYWKTVRNIWWMKLEDER